MLLLTTYRKNANEKKRLGFFYPVFLKGVVYFYAAVPANYRALMVLLLITYMHIKEIGMVSMPKEKCSVLR